MNEDWKNIKHRVDFRRDELSAIRPGSRVAFSKEGIQRHGVIRYMTTHSNPPLCIVEVDGERVHITLDTITISDLDGYITRQMMED